MADAADKDDKGLCAGCQLDVVSSFQALSDARVTWIGSVDFFYDKFANKEISKYVYALLSFCCVILILSKGVKSGNTQFAHDIAAWTF